MIGRTFVIPSKKKKLQPIKEYTFGPNGSNPYPSI